MKTFLLGDALFPDLDPDTEGLLISFLLSILMATLVVIFWIVIRGCRGDKQEIDCRHCSEVTEIHFDENFKRTQERGVRETGRL
jgi:hypothetical protein